MAVLIDTSFLLAAFYERDVNHAKAMAVQHRLLKEERIIPMPVLQETFFMVNARVSYMRAISAFESLQQSLAQNIEIIPDDLQRMSKIMRQYRDAEFDFTDCAIMALAERLNIRHIYTFDRRDFSLFMPRHCDHLELLP
jgi:predicted nucleic acid-binding protein